MTDTFKPDPDVIALANEMEQAPAWAAADKDARAQMIRGFALSSRGAFPDPAQHAALLQELWSRSDPRGKLRKVAEWTGNAAKEAVASSAAGMVPFVQGASDAVGLTDSGSGERFQAGVRNLADTIVMRAEQLAVGDDNPQTVRNKGLDLLKAAIDRRQYPAGVEDWLSGAKPLSKLDEDSRGFIGMVNQSLGVAAVNADYGGKPTDPKAYDRYLNSDRALYNGLSEEPGAADIPRAGPRTRDLLADYVATGDPSSWDQFSGRVKETDAHWKGRLRTYQKDQERAAALKELDGNMAAGLLERGLDIQGSPGDLLTSALPLLRGSRALHAAKTTTLAQAAGHAVKDMAGEALSEGATTYLQEANAPMSQVLEDAAAGAVGQGAVTAGGTVAGKLMARATAPPAANDPTLPADNPSGPIAPLMDGAAPELLPDEVFAQRAAALEARVSAAAPEAAGVDSPATPEGPDAGLFPVAAGAGDSYSNPEAPIETSDPVISEPPLTPPTPADPQGTVPERPEDLAAQRERVAADRKPAMILPGVPAEDAARLFPPLPDETWTPTPEGAVLHKPALLPAAQVEQEAAAGTMGNVLGYGMPSRPAAPTAALVHRDSLGRELAAVAVDEATYGQAYTALAAQASPGDTIQPEAPEATLQRRMAPAQNLTSGLDESSNRRDPGLSPDLVPGSLPSDAAALITPLDPVEADRRTVQLERSLRAEGALRPSDGLQLRDTDQLAVGRPSLGFAAALGGVFGRRVLTVRNKAGGRLPFNGVTNQSIRDTIFIDENSKMAPASVAGHELLHHLETSHPDLFRGFDNVVRPLLTGMDKAKVQYRAYLDSPNPDLNVRREVYADFLSQSLYDPMFWSQLSRRQPGIFMPLARAVWNWFGQAVNALRVKGWSASSHFKDLLQARGYLADAVAEFAARENGIAPTLADQLFNEQRTENFFSGRQDMKTATPEQSEARMAAAVEQLRSAEDALQEGWNRTRSTEMERTREGDPVIPTAYKVRKNADMMDAAHEWLSIYAERAIAAGTPANQLGNQLLEALTTGKNPLTNSPISGDVAAFLLQAVGDRVPEFGIDRREYEAALQVNASRAGRNLAVFREVWDPVTKFKDEIDTATETALADITDKPVLDVTKEVQTVMIAEVGQEIDAILTTGGTDLSTAAGAMPGSNLDLWLRGQDVKGIVLSIGQLVRSHLQSGRWASERFAAGLQRLFPDISPATAQDITDELTKLFEEPDDGGAAATRMSKAETIAARWVDKLATSQSDTLSWDTPAARAVHPLTKLIRAHLGKLNADFQTQAIALGATPQQARVLDLEIRKEHSIKAAIKDARDRSRLAAARERAIRKYMERYTAKAKAKPSRWKGYSEFVKRLVQAGELGILDSQAFLDAYAVAYNLHGLTADRVQRLKAIHDRIIATDESGRPVLYGSVRETVEAEFAKLVNAVSPAQTWMKFANDQLTAGMLSGISTMTSQLSGLVRLLGGLNALTDAYQYRGLDPRAAAGQWLQEMSGLYESRGLFVTALRGEALGISPSELTKTKPGMQSTYLMDKGERVRINNRTLGQGASTLARLREMYVWRFLRGAEGLSGVADASRHYENLLIEHYRKQGMDTNPARLRARSEVYGSAESRDAAAAQAAGEQAQGLIGRNAASLNKRVHEIIQRRIDEATGSDLTNRSEWLTSYSQFKTEPVSALGYGIAALGRLITSPDFVAVPFTDKAVKIPNVSKFVIKFTRFLGHNVEQGMHYMPGLHFLTRVSEHAADRRLADIQKIFGSREAYNKMVDSRMKAGLTVLLAAGGLQALALAMRGKDEDEPWLNITGTLPMEDTDLKRRIEQTGTWGEQQIRIGGVPILSYGQIPELGPLLTVIGNGNDAVRFSGALGKLGEKDAYADKSVVRRGLGWTGDLALSPLRRSTFRQFFDIVQSAIDGKDIGEKLNKAVTMPIAAAVKVPVIGDVDRAMRTLDGPRQARGLVDNTLRRLPFVIAGEKMVNAYGEELPSFGYLSMLPATGPQADPRSPSAAAARLNLDTGTRRSTPDGPQYRDQQGHVLQLPAGMLEAYQRTAGRLYTAALLDAAPAIQEAYRTGGTKAAQKLVAKISKDANRAAKKTVFGE